MSKINELIQELCPNGVEFKYIWEVTAWDKKFNAVDNSKQPKTHKYTYLLASALRKLVVEGGDVKLLSTGGEAYGWTTEELAGKSISEGEIIAIPWGGKATVQYYNGKFVTADNRIATSLDTNYLDNKFLYYFMLSKLRTIQSFYRGSGIQHPSMAKVLDMKMPIPPLEVQKEIVNILDKFTQLEAELEAELEARRKQYEYYRNQLLTFDESRERVRWLTLGDVGKVSMCKRIFKNQTLSVGDIPFYKIGTFGKVADAYISKAVYDEYHKKYSFPKMGDVLLSASGTIGRTVVYDGEPAYFQDSNIIWLDNDESIVTNKYLFHVYKIITWQTEGGTIQRLYNDNFKKIKIAVPDKQEQDRIVSILDQFEKLVTDIFSGIPAEINARRQAIRILSHISYLLLRNCTYDKI
jgi:type I restriction enzyme S subunit